MKNITISILLFTVSQINILHAEEVRYIIRSIAPVLKDRPFVPYAFEVGSVVVIKKGKNKESSIVVYDNYSKKDQRISLSGSIEEHLEGGKYVSLNAFQQSYKFRETKLNEKTIRWNDYYVIMSLELQTKLDPKENKPASKVQNDLPSNKKKEKKEPK